MAYLPFMFVCLCSVLVNSEVQLENDSNSYRSEISAVLNHLNSSSFKVYQYKEATLLHAHTKADITELALDINVDCINKYPDVPCTEKVLTCYAFVQGSQVLNDVNCKPKPEIIVEEPAYEASTNPSEIDSNEPKSIALSNEAVSSEVGEPFMAVRRDSGPCLGCPFDLNTNAEGVDELVDLALEHVGSERPNKQALIKVLKLQQQVVSGVKYILVAEIAPTMCTKEANHASDSCPLDSNSDTTICQIVYLQKPWISGAKHVISNNCTVSQEFVKSDTKKTEMSNEIDLNDQKAKSAVNPPNFDQIAETGTIEEMTPARLTDLESQILVEDSSHQEMGGSQRKLVEVEVPSTVESQIQLESQPSTEVVTSQPETNGDDGGRPKRGESEESSEENKKGLKQEKSSEESKEEEVKSTPNPLNSTEETVTEESRQKRAIPQLEKISPEEKGLVKNLADFAAAALDNIDDDNHKRIILQILGAKKMVGDDGVYYHLIMRMGISRCLEDKPPSPYENCREKLFENYTKICKVQVYVNDDFGPKVVKSQCQNIKRDKNDSNRTNYSRFKRDRLVGAPAEIDKDSDEIKALVNEGVTQLNAKRNTNKYKPVETTSATSQVVAGILYKIKIKISETDCSKNEQKDLDDCKVLTGVSPKICEVQVWEKSWENFRQFKISCEGDDQKYIIQTNYNRAKRSAPGGEFSVDEDDEFLIKYLEGGLTHLDTQSTHQNKYKVDKVLSATSQVVAGHIYRIQARIVLSDCKKATTTKRDQCGTLEGAHPKTCTFVVFEQLWQPGSRKTNVSCESEQRQYPRITGFLGSDDRQLHFAMFNDFIKKHSKNYSKKEFKYRFKVFSENMLRIRVLNTYEQGTASYGVTQFADLTQNEFSKSRGLRMDLRNENQMPFAQAQIPDIELPDAFDWRTKGAVTEVKNQEECGSCWAFSVTGNVEGQYALKNGKLLEFSEQELVDCDTEDQGCNGGLMDTAYREIEKLGGLETEQDYPYDAEDETCHFNSTLARVQLSGAVNISHNETDMAKWLVANGPISIAINANAMQFYMGGVSHPFKFLCSPNNLDHGVLIVGYGVHTYPLFKKSLPYWIVKNSWGTSWGEQGYYRVYRGDGTCGLNQTPSSAIVA